MNISIRQLFTDSLEALDPSVIVPLLLTKEGIHSKDDGIRINFKTDTPVYLLATGKAALKMSVVIKQILGDRLICGIVITGEDPSGKFIKEDENFIRVIQSAHPIPDQHSVEAGKHIVDFLKEIPETGILINALSGGTSSLLCLPGEGVTTDDLSETFRLLNHSGATIREMNTIRKHLSRIKGGQLLEFLAHNVILADLVISDVPDDDLEIIGSGPTIPDPSTFQDAYHILLEYELWNKIPESVHKHLEKGLTGEVPETLKPGQDPLKEHYSMIIGSAKKLASEIAGRAWREGYHTWVADAAYNDDVEDVASMIAEQVQQVENSGKPVSRPAVLIFYGESTVEVNGDGEGGRNQELALRGALKIREKDDIIWLSAGTDGVDGPTDAAGAIVDGSTIKSALNKGLDPKAFLRRNDAYNFHEQAGTLLKTGLTGNNLMDIQIVLMK